MNVPTTEFLLCVNGIQPAFGIEFGLSSPRAGEGRAGGLYRQVHLRKVKVRALKLLKDMV